MTMPTDIGFQLDVSLRLLAAAAFGAGLGLEREVHGHPAGMRTHMLVSLGSAIFTVLSIYGFPRVEGTTASDPSRIAAQVVTGIGFLGAGAIAKFGPNIRGLTTAGSLWVVASVGIAAGAGAFFVAVFGTLVAMFALWPLHVVVQKLELARGRTVRVRLRLKKLDSFAAVTQVLLSHRIAIGAIQSRKAKSGHLMEVELRLASQEVGHTFLAEIEAIPGVTVDAVIQAEEA
jgi:putative Mg2+ transporter-C (MgtC) family protein